MHVNNVKGINSSQQQHTFVWPVDSFQKGWTQTAPALSKNCNRLSVGLREGG